MKNTRSRIYHATDGRRIHFSQFNSIYTTAILKNAIMVPQTKQIPLNGIIFIFICIFILQRFVLSANYCLNRLIKETKFPTVMCLCVCIWKENRLKYLDWCQKIFLKYTIDIKRQRTITYNALQWQNITFSTQKFMWHQNFRIENMKKYITKPCSHTFTNCHKFNHNKW